MTWLASGLKQVYGLFVDDGWLSLAVCIWLLIAWFVLPHFVTSASTRPIVLFVGLALLLADSVRRGVLPHGHDAK
ncbi:MAG TPA: hypothetical protein VN934_03010 [Candidatus Tumulicola sp.]|nr:hypothetical protein [Candidatus Tumulicola sp.]